MINVFEKENAKLRELIGMSDKSYREFRKVKIQIYELIESTINNELIRMLNYSESLNDCVIKNFDFGETCALVAYDGLNIQVPLRRTNIEISNLVLEAFKTCDLSRVVFY